MGMDFEAERVSGEGLFFLGQRGRGRSLAVSMRTASKEVNELEPKKALMPFTWSYPFLHFWQESGNNFKERGYQQRWPCALESAEGWLGLASLTKPGCEAELDDTNDGATQKPLPLSCSLPSSDQ